MAVHQHAAWRQGKGALAKGLLDRDAQAPCRNRGGARGPPLGAHGFLLAGQEGLGPQVGGPGL